MAFKSASVSIPRTRMPDLSNAENMLAPRLCSTETSTMRSGNSFSSGGNTVVEKLKHKICRVLQILTKKQRQIVKFQGVTFSHLVPN